ncbi:allophanate hydrolase, partial [Neorhizobium sp. SHOUNA12B]|nr:allophanate hydrolase [Neorhizobium sp. SHOUNA12B]
ARDLHQASGLTLGATGWPLPAPSETPAVVASDDLIDVIVVGAHLSGMPLNHQLTDLDGTFSRVAKTSAAYRLYALAGTVPPKPGMVRVAEGEGGEIEVEVWKLTPAAFGLFVAAIPPPLGIGTVTLSDGTSAKGFLAEPFALQGALDITAFGGWRAYLKEFASLPRVGKTA